MELKERVEFKNLGITYEKDSLGRKVLKIIFFGFFIINIVASIVFRCNMFGEYSILIYGGLLVVFVSILKTGKTSLCPEDAVLEFYDDYFILYRPKVRLKCNSWKKCSITMRYDDVREVRYREGYERFVIVGKVHAKESFINEDGSDAKKLNYFEKDVDSGMEFYSTYSPEIDFLGLLKKYIGKEIEVIK